MEPKMTEVKGSITPAQAIKILKKQGIVLSEDNVRQVIDFLYQLAQISIEMNSRENEQSNIIYQGKHR